MTERKQEMSAYDELLTYLQPDEVVEAIVLGDWGGLRQPVIGSIPHELRNRVLPLEVAKPFMQAWHFAPRGRMAETYAVYIWTDQRAIWVHEYDGETCLASMPRNPADVRPRFSGG